MSFVHCRLPPGSLRPVAASARVLLPLIALLLFGPLRVDAADRATGDWGGRRTRLAQAGVEIEVHYTAESYVLDADEGISYLGNLDVMLTLDTARLGAWKGGRIFLYGQNNHGSGPSRDLGLLMPVSNLESESFTQLSEYWLEQQVGNSVLLRLGKQDTNRDFAAPRFGGNFVNSSFGVLPGSPLHSFPAPGLGAAVLADPRSWVGVRAGIYEGSPEVGSFGETAFQDDAGLLSIGQLVLRHELAGRDAGEFGVGGWTRTAGRDRSGVYALYDVLLPWNPGNEADPRSWQFFVHGGWSPEQTGEIGTYAGGGVTAHGFLGENNTIGLGAGYAKSDTSDETFVEIFFKWRPRVWFTVEPDLQFYDTAGGTPVFAGVRVKLKL
ncbi:MAG: carbohydrate porin [Candidatus Binatia bacterium]